jgi:hypothetical protein
MSRLHHALPSGVPTGHVEAGELLDATLHARPRKGHVARLRVPSGRVVRIELNLL